MIESIIQHQKRFSQSDRHYFEDIHFWTPQYCDFEWPKNDKIDFTQWIYKSNSKSNTIKNRIHSRDNIHHLIIFDWDDTLFFTTYVHDKFNFNQNKLQYPHFFDQEMVETINKIGELLFKMFAKLIRFYGADNIKIITAAAESWPNMCMTTLGPVISTAYAKFLGLIKMAKIEIMSARTQYLRHENKYTYKRTDDERKDLSDDENGGQQSKRVEYYYEDAVKWKNYTFHEVIKKHFTFCIYKQPDTRCCIQCIGDSWAEYNACRTGSDFMNVLNEAYRYLLRVVLLDEPDLNEFYMQLLSVEKIIDDKMKMLTKKEETINIVSHLIKYDKRLQIDFCLTLGVAMLVSVSMLVSIFRYDSVV